MPSSASSSATSVSGGDHRNQEFAAAVLMIFAMGTVNILANSFNPYFAGYTAAALAIFGFMWFKLHGMKLGRNERAYFDEKLLLDAKNDGNYNMVPLKSSGPRLLSNLLHNEEHRSMQSYYANHYGPVWKTGQRARILAEQRMKLLQQDEADQDGINMLCAKLLPDATIEEESYFNEPSEIEVE